MKMVLGYQIASHNGGTHRHFSMQNADGSTGCLSGAQGARPCIGNPYLLHNRSWLALRRHKAGCR